jgi:hypothetical protein
MNIKKYAMVLTVTLISDSSFATTMDSYLRCTGNLNTDMVILSSPEDLATTSGIVRWKNESLLFYYQNAIISVQESIPKSAKDLPFQIYRCPYDFPQDVKEMNFELTGFSEIKDIFAQIFPNNPQISDMFRRTDKRTFPPALASVACTKVIDQEETRKVMGFVDDVLAESAVKNCNRITKYLSQAGESEGRLGKDSLKNKLRFQAGACSQLQPFVNNPKLIQSCGVEDISYTPVSVNFQYLRRN